MLKVKNSVKITPSKLHYIHQHRGVLRFLSDIWDGDFSKISHGHSDVNSFSERLHINTS